MKLKWPLYRHKCLFWSWQCLRSLSFRITDAFKCVYQGSMQAQLLNWWALVPQIAWWVLGCSCYACAVSFCWWTFSSLSVFLGSTCTHETLALSHDRFGPGVKGRAKADASAPPAAEGHALLQRASQYWTPSDPVQLCTWALEKNWWINTNKLINIQATETHDQKIFLNFFPLNISALKFYSAFHSTFRSQCRQTCLASAMLQYGPNYTSEVLLNSLKTCSVEIWT